ncbi:hypothetical protein, partial [Dokdonella sp.]|uniref:hypothetical protein n=1 Tax=Dokdonella sp. TaxID=2291710 RepID=UPI002F413EC9
VHSGVDYPLRTPALMAACALLAGIAVAAAGAPSTRDGEMSRKRVVASAAAAAGEAHEGQRR